MVEMTEILRPVFAMAVLTAAVLLRLAWVRLTAISQKKIPLSYYQTFQGQDLPDWAAKPARNFINLFEVPVLFYIVAILIFVTHKTDSFFCNLAWIYVFFRALHSLIHVTFNNVRLRFAAFLLSNATLMILWIRLGTQLF